MAPTPIYSKETRTSLPSEKVNRMQLHLSLEEQNVKPPIKVKDSLVAKNGISIRHRKSEPQLLLLMPTLLSWPSSYELDSPVYSETSRGWHLTNQVFPLHPSPGIVNQPILTKCFYGTASE